MKIIAVFTFSAIVVSLVVCTAEAGYTKEHIRESCENYKDKVEGKGDHLYRTISDTASVATFQPPRFWIYTGFLGMLQLYNCDEFIQQLEEDHS